MKTEMDASLTAERPLPPISKESYLSRLPQADQTNIQEIMDLFRQNMEEKGQSGTIRAVGGVLTKPLPRPDIDLAVSLASQEPNPNPNKYPNHYLYTLAQFETFKQLVGNIVQQSNRFQISQIYEPAIDEEFNSPSILKHDGSIVVINKSGQGLPIELIKDDPEPSDQTFPDNRPSVLLISVTPLRKKDFRETSKFIPLPNLRNPEVFQKWLTTYITIPFKGFEDLTHPDGRPYTPEEQLAATRKQVVDHVHARLRRKDPLEEILRELIQTAHDQNP